jgi:hypothetical protein
VLGENRKLYKVRYQGFTLGNSVEIPPPLTDKGLPMDCKLVGVGQIIAHIQNSQQM